MSQKGKNNQKGPGFKKHFFLKKINTQIKTKARPGFKNYLEISPGFKEYVFKKTKDQVSRNIL